MGARGVWCRGLLVLGLDRPLDCGLGRPFLHSMSFTLNAHLRIPLRLLAPPSLPLPTGAVEPAEANLGPQRWVGYM